jgi:hypothetical protein
MKCSFVTTDNKEDVCTIIEVIESFNGCFLFTSSDHDRYGQTQFFYIFFRTDTDIQMNAVKGALKDCGAALFTLS